MPQSIYFLGGNTGGRAFTPTCNCYVYMGAASAPPPIPGTCLEGFGYTVANKTFWLVGGDDVNNNVVTTINIYSPVTNAWTVGPPLVTARWRPIAATLNDVVYVFAGSSTNIVTTVELCTLAACNTLNVANANLFLYAMAGAVVDRTVYLVGGYDGSATRYATVLAFNTTTYTLTPVAPLNYARAGAAAATMDGLLYVVGGNSNSFAFVPPEVYNPATNIWSTLTSAGFSSFPIIELVVVAYQGQIYAIGGQQSLFCRNSVYKYDPGSPATGWVESYVAARTHCRFAALVF